MRDRCEKLLRTIEELQQSEGEHELAARRAERELREEKERAAQLEKELEAWKARMEKASVAGSVYGGGSVRDRHVGWAPGAATEDGVRVPQRKSSLSRVPSMTKGFL
jgi:myosin protein heavy chain